MLGLRQTSTWTCWISAPGLEFFTQRSLVRIKPSFFTERAASAPFLSALSSLILSLARSSTTTSVGFDRPPFQVLPFVGIAIQLLLILSLFGNFDAYAGGEKEQEEIQEENQVCGFTTSRDLVISPLFVSSFYNFLFFPTLVKANSVGSLPSLGIEQRSLSPDRNIPHCIASHRIASHCIVSHWK